MTLLLVQGEIVDEEQHQSLVCTTGHVDLGHITVADKHAVRLGAMFSAAQEENFQQLVSEADCSTR